MNLILNTKALAVQCSLTTFGLCAHLLSATSACAEMRPEVPEIAPGIWAGYLAKDERLNSARLIPPPPGSESAAADLDQQIRVSAKQLRDTARWHLAIKDASLTPDAAIGAFSCATGIDLSRETTPRLFQLLQRVMVDAGTSTDGAKKLHRAVRPYIVHGDAMCTPEDDSILRADGSYPSGHAALGWGAALVLSQILPDRAHEILARGRAFGESRIICNVHWQSDIIAGRFMGSAIVAVLGSKPDYRADVEIARAEVHSACANGKQPKRDCTAEAAALETRLPGGH